MKKVLDITDSPITSYPSIAYIFSMLWNKKEIFLPWLCDHFIQIIIRPRHKDTPADYYDHADINNFYREIYGIPWLSWMRVNKETVKCKKLSDYIEFQINKGYGVECCVDRFFFPFTLMYKKEHFIHSSFVYGYNKLKRIVYIIDFWDNGKYSKEKISYSKINKSWNNNGIINLFKLQEGHYQVNFELLKSSLEDYLNSTDKTHKYEFSNREYNKNIIFGLAYYDYVSNYCSDNEILDIRFFHILYDHKQIMTYRLLFLFNSKNITDLEYDILSKLNEDIITLSLKIRTMVIKYNYTKSSRLLENIKTELNSLKTKDRFFVTKLLAVIYRIVGEKNEIT